MIYYMHNELMEDRAYRRKFNRSFANLTKWLINNDDLRQIEIQSVKEEFDDIITQSWK